MAQKRPTVLLRDGTAIRKLLKVWFGPDGSYYVAAPYHSARRAFLIKYPLTYNMYFMERRFIAHSECQDVAILDDSEGAIKLSHHPSGLCQFSGEGVLSGVDNEGRIKGIGVHTRALKSVGDGPAWSFEAYGFNEFDQCHNVHSVDVAIDFNDLAEPAAPDTEPWPDNRQLPAPVHAIVVEGYYFRPDFRNFVRRDSNGHFSIMRVHPTGAVLKLIALLAPKECEIPGFLGLDFRRTYTRFPHNSGFVLNGPGETIGEDPMGHRIANVISCIYPRPENVEGARTLNYPGREAMDSVNGDILPSGTKSNS